MPKHYHFIGICGTAMGSVAAALKARGCDVTGSDANVYPPMSTFLGEAGIAITEGFRPENIPPHADIVVVGNAISRGNPEVEEVLNRKLLYRSLPEVVKEEFLRGRRNLVVTGTHGKTTTSSLLAWILESAGRNPAFLIGGIPKNFGCGSRLNDSEFSVIEGDEYDTAFFDKRSKFLHYLPETVIVNNIEFDHADIYNNLGEIKLTFRRLLNTVPQNGAVFINGDDPNCLDVAKDCPAPVITVGTGGHCAHPITEIVYAPDSSQFSIAGGHFSVPMAGEFNVRNAAMAVVSAGFSGISHREIQSGLDSFQGVARRQEVRGSVRGITIIDDFAHHPTALAQAIAGLRQRYPNAKVWALFEPRSNTSRRNVHQAELCAALASADGAFIASVDHPEKIPASERLDPGHVVSTIRAAGREAYFEEDADSIVERLKGLASEGDVVGVFSNGGFGGIHKKLLERL